MARRRHTNNEAEAEAGEGRRRRREQAKQKVEEQRKRIGEPTRWSSHSNSLYFFCSVSIFLLCPVLRRKPQKHVFSELSLPSRARPQCRSNFKDLRRGEVTSRPSRSPKARRGDFGSKQARQCMEAEAQKQR
ncbi:hypothetical protein ACLB2K_072368 [Fragaria x ananassa]